MSETVTDILKNGSLKLVMAAFAMGVIYAGFQNLNTTQNQILKELESKADKSELKIIENTIKETAIKETAKTINHNEEMTHDLDKRVYYLENK